MSTCNGKNVDLNTITDCEAVMNEPVCLVCPTDETKGVSWTFGSEFIAQDHLTFGVIKGSTLNHCQTNKYSLRLNECNKGTNNTISCKSKEKILATFKVSCKQQGKLQLIS